MNKTMVLLGVILVSIIAVGIIYFVNFFAFVQPVLNKESKAWVDDTVPKIVTKWNVDDGISYSSPELLKITTKDDLKLLFATLSSKLGAFKRYNGSTGEAGIEIRNWHKMTTAEYIASADFVNGSAKISIRGIKEGGAWKLLQFHVDVI